MTDVVETKRRWSLGLKIGAIGALGTVLALFCAFPGFVNETKQLFGGSPSGASNPSSSTTPSALRTLSPSPAPKPTVSGPPAGWKPYTDEFSGYTIYVPPELVDSKRLIKSTQVFWGSEDGEWLRVDVTDHDNGDPYTVWTDFATDRSNSGCYGSSYSKIGIDRVYNYYDKAADWEFTWKRRPSSRLVHVVLRGVVSSNRGYGIWWQIPVEQWETRRHDMELLFASFQPGNKTMPNPEIVFDPTWKAACAG